MNWTELDIGYECQTSDFIMFFGNKAASLEKLKERYPSFSFRFLKQVHGNTCVESSSNEVEADAHFTDEKNIALCIRTADCNPVLIANEDRVCAIHAGWRGVMSEIVPLSVASCFSHSKEDMNFAVGPHIQKDSFQVDLKLGEEFSDKFGEEFVFRKKEYPDKAYVDLKMILESSLDSQILNRWISDEDTLTTDSYYSHRREPLNKGRNISFVARL